MKKATAVVALILVVSSVPSGMALHRSQGADDQVLVTQDDEPSVPDNGPDSPFHVGTLPSDECYEPEAEATLTEVARASEADGFCSALKYNEDLDDNDELVVESPEDQVITPDIGTDNPIATFDVVRMDSASTLAALTLCTPFCPPGEGFFGSGTYTDQLHEVFYDNAAEQTGLTDDSDTTDKNQKDDRRQYTYANVGFPNAAQFVQGQTNAWDMNGWVTPSATYYFAAFLEDGEGNQIGADRLSEIVQSSDLDGVANERICGFTPDFSITTAGAEDAAACELSFFYAEDDGSTDFRSYGDRCNSPTYMCNQAANGAYWRASLPLHSVFNYLGAADDSGFGNNNYREWHFVVAPRSPDCSAQEPGFLTESDETGAPFLAHDLDVYTPSTRLSTAGASPGPAEAYADEAAAGPTDTVFNTIPDLPLVDETVDAVTDTVDQATDDANDEIDQLQNDTVRDLNKDNRVEPNAASGAANPLADTSQSAVDLDRTGALDEVCQRVTSDEEPDTLDPWVDVIDGQTEITATSTTLYGNNDDTQDEENNPGPDRFSTAGNVGLFTDKNDDGDYDTVGDQFRNDLIDNAGAYPMVWDIKVDDSGDSPEITSDRACKYSTSNYNLALEAERLGYGPNTGLFQLVYLSEPTQFDAGLISDQRQIYPDGNNIYVLASQSVKELWDGDVSSTDDHPLGQEVDQAIADLQDWVVAETDTETAPDVRMPGDAFGFTSDFEKQCEESTGGFDAIPSFTHDCQAVSCEGDTIVTQYVFEAPGDGTFDKGSKDLPRFSAVNEITADFGGFSPGVNTWTDVDPLDGNPDRNDDQSSAPDA